MATRYYIGERIYLRPIETEDAPMLTVWLNDPANWATLGRSNPINLLREKEFIANLYKDQNDVVLGIATAADDRLIGVCGLHHTTLPNRCATFGITIGDTASQGQGFGTEATRLTIRYAFEELNLNRIDLTAFADHERAVRAYKRAGFSVEGRHRQTYFRNGRYHDTLTMAILREDWDLSVREQHTDAKLSSMTH